MGELIGGTYEVVQQIGTGGGGRVYLANHVRLNKWVVLKADKRKVTTSPVLLRREVDVLKNLSHPNIPQVYDFFVDGERVYTAMEFIQGESLDRPLERGERFSQAQIIKWSKQILNALVYLHAPTHGDPPRGYVHSDIKPANLMCKPDGDICLIDFNIALALGEENVIGSSPGYASPEHYGQDYTFEGVRAAAHADDTIYMENTTATQTMEGASPSRQRKKVIIPDARSDIYSLGATLYHMLSGKRPAKYAMDVTPLSEKEFNPQLAQIINKAMAPNPDERYQTAGEMLEAFRGLWENDPRTRRFKRTRNVVVGGLAAVLLAGAALSFAGMGQMERAQAAAAREARQAEEQERQFKEALTAVRASENAYQQGDIPAAIQNALEALSTRSPYSAQAQKALTDALGVYALADMFRPYQLIELSAQPLKIALSPKGERIAVLADGQVQVFETSSGARLFDFPAQESALADVCFTEEDTLVYAGRDGLRAYDLERGEPRWQGGAATSIALSADRSTVAAVYRDETEAVVYDVASGAEIKRLSFQGRRQAVPPNDRFVDPEDSLFALSGDGRWLAVSFADGGLRLFPVRGTDEDAEIFDTSDFAHFEGGFFGGYFAFCAADGEDNVFAVIDLNTMEQTGGFRDTTPFHVQVDETGIYLSSTNLLISIDPVSGEQAEVGYTGADITAFRVDGKQAVTATADGALAFFDRAKPLESRSTDGPWELLCLSDGVAAAADRDRQRVRLFTYETHPDSQIARYDPAFDHGEARLSPDGKSVLLFRYDALQTQTAQGEVMARVALPEAESIYDQQYIRENGKGYLEVTYYDGRVCRYDGVSGELVRQEQVPPPDESLQEEFLTDRYRVVSPLHGAPQAFLLESGEAVADLTSEGYLTYVTEVNGYLITEYITAEGERYGLLRDGDWAVLARLPQLCDILEDGTLVFDDKQGILRQSRIYSTQELMELGYSKLQGGNR